MTMPNYKEHKEQSSLNIAKATDCRTLPIRYDRSEHATAQTERLELDN